MHQLTLLTPFDDLPLIILPDTNLSTLGSLTQMTDDRSRIGFCVKYKSDELSVTSVKFGCRNTSVGGDIGK